MEADEPLAEHGITGRSKRCPGCGRLIPLRMGVDLLPAFGSWHYAEAHCERCDRYLEHFTTFWVAHTTREGREFWRKHPRCIFLPEREIESEGVPVLVTGCKSLTSGARLEVVLERDTFRRISVHVTLGS